MTVELAEQGLTTIDLQKDIEIAAPVDVVWESLLAEMGPESQMPDGTPFPGKLEAWPGGRWYRDLGNNMGHFWGNVQVIKGPPHDRPLLEICGPMFMSYPVSSWIQYRLTPEGRKTRLTVTHKAFGYIPQEHREGVNKGWGHKLTRVREIAERRKAAAH